MTDLNIANLQNSVNHTSQVALGKSINTKKTSILLWTNANSPNSFILKNNDGKRYVGLIRKDQRGEIYWAFKEINKKKNQSEDNSKNYVHNSNPSKG